GSRRGSRGSRWSPGRSPARTALGSWGEPHREAGGDQVAAGCGLADAGKLLRVQHEELVEDFEAKVRRILEFVALDFEMACRGPQGGARREVQHVKWGGPGSITAVAVARQYSLGQTRCVIRSAAYHPDDAFIQA